MLISIDWLKEFVDIGCTPEELQYKLVRAGFEIESIERQGDNCVNVVVGRVDKLSKHPDADKLQICDINVGSENVQIVTGANNIAVGDLVPVAKDDSLLPNGTRIKKGKLRGVMSYGMLCSGGELVLKDSDYPGAEVDGIMILKGNYAPGMDMNDVLNNNDIILDVGVTANRPDCNSVLGIAREVAAVLNTPLKCAADRQLIVGGQIDEMLKVKISNWQVCPHYMAAVVRNIVIKDSPEFIRRRLKAVGIRAINNIVDITNYVLIETGQPMHAFDYACLENGVINVRNANSGEQIIALDGKKYDLDSSMLVIADDCKPSAIGGVMGGELSGISSNTKTIVLESAKFARDSIRRTSRKLNLRSDSSLRYERGIDYLSQSVGLRRALELIELTQSGEIIGGIIDAAESTPSNTCVECEVSKINEILGIQVPEQTIVDILNSLNIATSCTGGKLRAAAPLYRDDIENANDLAEEVIRMYGYDNIVCSLPMTRQDNVADNSDVAHTTAIKNILIGSGMNEILTYSFTAPKMFDALCIAQDSPLRQAVKLINPLGEDMSIMRTTLAHSLLEVIAKNINRSNKELRLFEFARVYIPNELPLSDLPTEITHISLGLSGGNEDFYTLKGIVQNILDYCGADAEFVRSHVDYLHSGVSADIIVKGRNVGYIGEVHPSVIANYGVKEQIYIAEIDYNALIELFDNLYTFAPVPKFPSVARDLAVILDEQVTAKDILDTVRNAGGKILISAEIFDVYRGKGIDNGKKSVAINMKFNSVEKTLTDEEINAKIDKIIRKLQGQFGAVLR